MQENTFSNRQVIKCSNELNTASYRLSELGLNIIMALISEIKQDDNDFKPHVFYVKELEAKLGKKIERAYLEKVSDELLKSIIKIKRKESNSFLKLGWVSSFEFISSQSRIEISFDPKLKPYLLSIKEGFVIGYLKELVDVKGEYAKRIYMLVRQNAFKGSLSINLEELKTILVVPQSMEEFKVFNRRVIKHAIEQINSRTTLDVSYDINRIGRKVYSITFLIKEKFVQKNKVSENIGDWIGSDTMKINKRTQHVIDWAKQGA